MEPYRIVRPLSARRPATVLFGDLTAAMLHAPCLSYCDSREACCVLLAEVMVSLACVGRKRDTAAVSPLFIVSRPHL